MKVHGKRLLRLSSLTNHCAMAGARSCLCRVRVGQDHGAEAAARLRQKDLMTAEVSRSSERLRYQFHLTRMLKSCGVDRREQDLIVMMRFCFFSSSRVPSASLASPF